jgi:hypothetical protein
VNDREGYRIRAGLQVNTFPFLAVFMYEDDAPSLLGSVSMSFTPDLLLAHLMQVGKGWRFVVDGESG